MKIAVIKPVASEPDSDLTARALLVLGVEVDAMLDKALQLQTQVRALSRRHPL
jgi:hypothetical protein